MRCASVWTLVLVLGFSTSAWAQFGGGRSGGGEMMGSDMGMSGGMGMPGGMSMPGGMGMLSGMGMGAEMAAPEVDKGVSAYRAAPGDGGRFQVMWTGESAEACQKIAAMLQEETKVQFVETPLVEVVAYLKNLHNFPIEIDQTGLDHVGIDRDLPINANIDSLTLAATLDLLTRQHELGWYIKGGALVITSYDDADQDLSVRIYKLHRLEAAGTAKVVERIIFPESWNNLGGQADLAVIHDRNLLVIRQNREGHAAVESLLTQLEGMK